MAKVKMRKGKTRIVRVLSVLLAGCLCMTAVNADTLSELSDQKETLQQQQQELEDRSNALNEQLEQLKDDADKQQQYYTSLEKQIDVVEEQIDTANQRLEQLDEEISQTESDMADAQVQLEEDYDTLKQRLCALYKLGSAGTLEIILQAESLPDLAQKTEVMSAITRHDTQLIDSIHQQLETLEEQKQLLHDDREEADRLRTSLEEKKTELTGLQEESARVLAELESQQIDVSQQIDDTEAQKQELIDQLAQIQKEWLAELNKPTPTPEPTPNPTPKPQPGGGGSSGGTVTPETPSPTTPPSSSGYTWPVPGYPNVGDGWYEGGRPHKGIDIANHPTIPIYGQKIVAAADGKVLTAFTANTDGGGYGYHVIIDHGYDAKGRRITTLYAHMSAVSVKTGQTVKGGETVLGKAGRTGRVSGPHLHFEVRVNNLCVDPFGNGYLKRP